MDDGRPIAGMVAAITGAARGIGRATAQAFVGEGMKVAIGDLDRDEAERAAAEVGAGAIGLELDVAERSSFERFVDEAERRLGPLDVLVNNAGIMPVGRLVDEDDRTARSVVDVNVHGVLHGMKIALPRMCARGRGHLVNIASTGGKTGVPGAATYCGTKFFVVGVSEAARLELHGTGVEISCVMPGIVNTELTSGLARPRFAPKEIEPADVAAAIVEALRHPRFEVFVPRSLGATVRAAGISPRAVREGLARRLGLYEFSAHPDEAARRKYDERIAPR